MSFRIFLTCLLLTAPLGCAEFLAALPAVTAALNDAGAVLSIIQRALDTWYAVQPPSTETRTEANRLVADAWTALRIATAATSGTEKLSKEQATAAFADFRRAYGELTKFLQEKGVLQAQSLSLGGGETVQIPPPLALSL